MPLFHIRFEFSCFREVGSYVKVFICSMDIVIWVFPAGGLFLLKGCRHSRTSSQLLKIR